MNRLAFLALTIGLLLASAAPLRANSLDRVAAATVAIRCRAGDGPGGYIGTGMVINRHGYILTSTTVVPPKAVDIRCSLLGVRALPARLIVADEKLELAVIKVDPISDEELTVMPLGDSRAVTVGQTVFTVGDGYSAFDRSGQFTVSLGIISGIYEVARQTAPQPVYVGRMLECSATVAPGMDGGPLLDSAGRLIGMLSLNVSDVRWMGLAVPLDALLEPMRKAILADAANVGLKADDVTPAIDRGRGTSLFPIQERQDQSFSQSARKAAESVVAIEVDRRAERTAAGRQPARRPQPRPDAAAYSGFFTRPKAPVTGVIVSPDGHILTSYYNVWGELNSIHVLLPDGRRLEARMLGFDEANDLAMLKVEANGLTPIKLADKTPTLTTQIAAIGRSPDPKTITITRGIVSAVGRLNAAAIQIDAPVNYANSGGPVIDINGDCVGVVTHVRPDSTWGQNSGIGFAATAPVITRNMPALTAGKVVERPKRGFLGVTMSQGELDVAGVVIERVQPDGPAEGAGLRSRDIITRVDGQAVADASDLARAISSRQPGEVVRLTVLRGQQTLTVEVTLGESPF